MIIIFLLVFYSLSLPSFFESGKVSIKNHVVDIGAIDLKTPINIADHLHEFSQSFTKITSVDTTINDSTSVAILRDTQERE